MTRSTSGNRTSFWISQPDRPGADAEDDVRVGPAHLDRLVARQGPAGEDRRALDQQVAGPGEAEAGADQQLPAVGGDDLVAGALELDAVRGRSGSSRAMPVSVASARAVSSSAGLDAQVAGSSGHLARAVDGRDVILAALRDAAVLPADDGPVGRGGLEDDGRVGRALEVGQGVERDGDGSSPAGRCPARRARRPGRGTDGAPVVGPPRRGARAGGSVPCG